MKHITELLFLLSKMCPNYIVGCTKLIKMWNVVDNKIKWTGHQYYITPEPLYARLSISLAAILRSQTILCNIYKIFTVWKNSCMTPCLVCHTDDNGRVSKPSVFPSYSHNRLLPPIQTWQGRRTSIYFGSSPNWSKNTRIVIDQLIC